MASIESIAETAAVLYRRGTPFKDAVTAALNQHGERNLAEREVIFKRVCSMLSQRGNKKKAAMKAHGVQRERQGTFRFSHAKGS